MNDLNASFLIGSLTVGIEQPPLIIAEVAQAHDGSLGTAHAFIDAVAETGVEAIKISDTYSCCGILRAGTLPG